MAVVNERRGQAQRVGLAQEIAVQVIGIGISRATRADDLGQVQVAVVIDAGDITQRIDGFRGGAEQVEVAGGLVAAGGWLFMVDRHSQTDGMLRMAFPSNRPALVTSQGSRHAS